MNKPNTGAETLGLPLPDGVDLSKCTIIGAEWDTDGYAIYHIKTPQRTANAEYIKQIEARLNAPTEELAKLRERVADIMEGGSFDGCFTGLFDRNGTRIYYGDTLEFDECEWGEKGYRFKVKHDPINGPAHSHEYTEWCTVVEKGPRLIAAIGAGEAG